MELINLEDATEILLRKVSSLEEYEEKEILDSLGYVLGDDIYSPINNPPFNRSPLDGFSFKSICSEGATKNSPQILDVISAVYAGDYYQGEIPLGKAIKIMTGAPIPKGCDCVIRQEDVNYDEQTGVLHIFNELKEFENFSFMGEDFKKGDLILKRGELLTYNHIGLLAALGISKVKVYRKPIVGILSLGSELTIPGEKLEEGKIYNSNLYTISSKLKYLGADTVCYPPLEDDVDIVKNFIDSHLEEVDFFITTGGVSVGEKDIMHEVIDEINAKKLFWKVDIQPGTPVLASEKEGKIILSLSGNPFAALVNFELLARPILYKLSHGAVKKTKVIFAMVKGEFKKRSIKRRFIRGYCDHGEIVVNNEKHSSGIITSLINKNALIDIPPGTECLNEGDIVKVILID